MTTRYLTDRESIVLRMLENVYGEQADYFSNPERYVGRDALYTELTKGARRAPTLRPVIDRAWAGMAGLTLEDENVLFDRKARNGSTATQMYSDIARDDQADYKLMLDKAGV